MLEFNKITLYSVLEDPFTCVSNVFIYLQDNMISYKLSEIFQYFGVDLIDKVRI